jgi:hypothetical protein
VNVAIPFALQVVPTSLASEPIPPVAADELVVPPPADDHVGIESATQPVIAAEPQDAIAPPIAADHIARGRSPEEVASARALDLTSASEGVGSGVRDEGDDEEGDDNHSAHSWSLRSLFAARTARDDGNLPVCGFS